MIISFLWILFKDVVEATALPGKFSPGQNTSEQGMSRQKYTWNSDQCRAKYIWNISRNVIKLRNSIIPYQTTPTGFINSPELWFCSFASVIRARIVRSSNWCFLHLSLVIFETSFRGGGAFFLGNETLRYFWPAQKAHRTLQVENYRWHRSSLYHRIGFVHILEIFLS